MDSDDTPKAIPARAEPVPRYRAFICYSQRDKIAAERLHKLLETYRVPRELVARKGRWGAIPERLSPVFRDREELAASADIGERLLEALARSQSLIVLCSPAAAQSRWVNAEIEAFRSQTPGNRDRVFAVILAGEPLPSDAPGNCLPPALRGGLAADETMGVRIPLAADFRPGHDHQRDAELRLIAGLLGAEFDDLRRREEERRIQRLRRTVTIAAALVVAFAALAGYALGQREQARRAAARATVARAEAEKLVDFMLTELRDRLTAIGKLDLLQPANERVLAYYENVVAIEDDPATLRRRAVAFHQQGMDLRNRKNVAAAMQALLTAAALGERLVTVTPADTAALLALADTRRLLANQRQEAGDTTGALQEIEQAERRLREAMRLHPADRRITMRLASLRTEEAESLIRSGQTARAAARLDEAMGTFEDLLARDPKLADLPDRASAAAWKLGVARRRMGDFARAEPAFRRSIELARQLAEATPDNIITMRRHQLALGSLGAMLNDAGRAEDALKVLQEALAGAREIVARDSTNLIYQDNLAATLSNMCASLVTLERNTEALPLTREMVARYEQMIADGSTEVRTQTGLAMGLSTLAATLSAVGKHDEALATARRAVTVQQTASGRDPADVKMRDDLGYVHSRLATICSSAGRFAEAVTEYRTAVAVMDEILAKDAGNPQLVRKGERAQWQAEMGLTLTKTGAHAEAREVLAAAIDAIDAAVKKGLSESIHQQTRQKAAEALAKLEAK